MGLIKKNICLFHALYSERFEDFCNLFPLDIRIDLLIRVEREDQMSKEEDLKRRISELESINDQLSAELRYLDELLKEIGFEDGLITLKSAALELLDQDQGED